MIICFNYQELEILVRQLTSYMLKLLLFITFMQNERHTKPQGAVKPKDTKCQKVKQNRNQTNII